MQTAGNKVYSNLPDIIRTTLVISEGWLVGSAVDSVAPRDYDIIVTDMERWGNTVLSLSHLSFSLNSFGGHKYQIGELYSIDVWPQSFERFVKLQKKPCNMYNLAYRIKLYLEG